MSDPIFTPLEIALFWSKVDTSRYCWKWRASQLPNGYGSFKWRGRNQQAHRIAWQIFNGRLLESGEYILHRCDNVSCCRPDHLFPGSQLDNMRDKIAKGRDVYAHGEDHYLSELNTEQVQEIRRRRASGESGRALAKEYGVKPATICDIHRRRTWKHIQ